MTDSQETRTRRPRIDTSRDDDPLDLPLLALLAMTACAEEAAGRGRRETITAEEVENRLWRRSSRSSKSRSTH